MPYTVFASKSTKGAKKAKSDQSRRFLILDDSVDMDESMSVELFYSGESHEATAKSAKKAKASDVEGVSAESKRSNKDENVIADSKSSKAGKSFKPIIRSIDPLKSQSYIEYTRAQVPASASAPSDESSGAISFGFAASLFGIAALITASAVAMN